MKSQVNPAVAIGLIVALVLIAGFLIYKKSSSDTGYVSPEHTETKTSKAQK